MSRFAINILQAKLIFLYKAPPARIEHGIDQQVR